MKQSVLGLPGVGGVVILLPTPTFPVRCPGEIRLRKSGNVAKQDFLSLHQSGLFIINRKHKSVFPVFLSAHNVKQHLPLWSKILPPPLPRNQPGSTTACEGVSPLQTRHSRGADVGLSAPLGGSRCLVRCRAL